MLNRHNRLQHHSTTSVDIVCVSGAHTPEQLSCLRLVCQHCQTNEQTDIWAASVIHETEHMGDKGLLTVISQRQEPYRDMIVDNNLSPEQKSQVDVVLTCSWTSQALPSSDLIVPSWRPQYQLR